MHSQSRGRIVGYTVSSSVSISALSGGYVHDKGTPQCIVKSERTELHRAAKKECANWLAQQPALAKKCFLGPLCVQTDLHRADKMDCAICANWLAQISQNVLYNLCELNCTEQPNWSVQTDSRSSQLRPKIQSVVFFEIEILFSSRNFLSGGNFGHQIFVC